MDAHYRGTALTRRPSPELDRGVRTHLDYAPVDPVLAARQYLVYQEALASAGWRVREVDVDYGVRTAGSRSKVTGTVLGTVFRYLAYRFWVYAKPLDSEPGFAPSTASEMAAITGSLPVVGQDRARRRTGSTAHGTPGAPEPVMGDDRQGPEAEASDLSSR